ncbi:1-phosphatidylinositol 4,5-bisphosphate phosphodiesterase delta-3 isoform X3 [Dromiciops gliroides]|uniref:1-phosphatidylinositol 4,5-bisphosphate phosphodiesterase delta-3 isoform X3 n=1 Tax=Dromiciops gliroides TaxID=33562 RepID=UPI001CC43C6D|nr:1-phosphatidylinositol 4,5-bisphosphate phosphodiesterase delta-3 isoform X3 [Dromiciops gliroides]
MPCPWWKRRRGGELESSFRILVSDGGSQEGVGLRALKKMDLNEDEDVLAMLKGSQFCKIRSLKWHKARFYRLQEDCMTVWFQRRYRHPKSHHVFSLQHIEAVRQGHQSEGLRRYGGAFPSSCCLTITFKGRRKNLDLAAPTEEEAQRWVRGLAKLRARLDAMSQREKLDHWIHGYLHQADSDHDSKMSFKEIKHLLQMVNVTMDDMYAHQLFKECDSSQNERLEDAEIEEFLRRLLKRPELEEIFYRYSGEDQILSAAELLEFLRDQGEEGATMAQAQHLIRTYELNEKAKQHDLMMLDGFMMYLLSPEGAVLDPSHRDVYQDMTQPLSHYFISSSHNTYLTQSQIGGASSTEAYIRAFAQGCRCVELDCWEGPDGEPVVYHGHTFTSKILFRDVIQVVRDHAFLLSPYPVILSLENHCGMQQQSTMARYLRTILGNMLVTETLDGKIPKELPSPEQLKGKVLVKGKKQIVHQNEEAPSDLPDDQEDEVKLLKVKSLTKRRKSSTPKLEESVLCYIEEGKEEQDEESEEGEEGEAEAGEYRKQTKRKFQISSGLSDLVVYCCTSHLNATDLPGTQPQPCWVPSLNERKARKFIKEAGNNFVRHNACQLCRVYPLGLRMTSANYNPQEMWNGGCQLVALNFQTPGYEMDLNNGRFLVNGKCGYVLKPDFLRQRDTTFDPERPGPPQTTLIIKVLTAQQLPKLNREKPNSIVDPLVRVEIYGVPRDCAQKETNYVLNNGFNPYWGQTLQFSLGAPELALVRFVVEDYDATSFNDFVGQFTLPLYSLKQGYRHIHLFSKDGASLSPATLFVHIQIKISGPTPEICGYEGGCLCPWGSSHHELALFGRQSWGFTLAGCPESCCALGDGWTPSEKVLT